MVLAREHLLDRLADRRAAQRGLASRDGCREHAEVGSGDGVRDAGPACCRVLDAAPHDRRRRAPGEAEHVGDLVTAHDIEQQVGGEVPRVRDGVLGELAEVAVPPTAAHVSVLVVVDIHREGRTVVHRGELVAHRVRGVEVELTPLDAPLSGDDEGQLHRRRGVVRASA